jgi:VWFA-related protein
VLTCCVLVRVTLGYAVLLACPFLTGAASAQDGVPGSLAKSVPNEKSADVPVFRSTSALVYLDVTVVDKKGHPVVTGLTQEDFSITEDGKPERIFSFEAPDAHGLSDVGLNGPGSRDKGQGSLAPETILLLDLLNTRYDDFSFVRDQAHKYLVAQPETLPGPTELLVLGNTSIKVLQEPTRSRGELLAALDHMPRSVPFKANYQLNFLSELIRQSYDALQQMSIQNRGVPGRKNVIWLGMGPPAIDDARLTPSNREAVRLYVRDTVNLMVESRMTLFQINPGFQVSGTSVETKGQGKEFATGKTSGESYTPFAAGNRRFSEFVDGTGGKLFNENDVSVALGESLELGANYYTLTYQPPADGFDGRFRKIAVKLRNPDLRVLTKTGFFALDKDEAGSDKPLVDMLRDAAAATLPFSALAVRVTDVVRHPDAGMVELTVEIDDSRVHWQAEEDGKSSLEVMAMGAGKSAHGDLDRPRLLRVPFVVYSQNAEELARAKPKFKMTLPLSRDSKSVRLAIAVNDGDRVGTVDIDRKTLDAAPEAPTANPGLQSVRKKVAAQ